MKFKVSTNIKSILGKDLISDKYIAIFELVKNSCDASAEKVTIEFVSNNEQRKIIISDDGCGMSTVDLENKWLFLAYSEKKELNKNGKKFAGSKGIGRFSCDRLGSKVTLYTKTKEALLTEKLVIDWSKFENNDLTRVEEIDLFYEQISALPTDKKSGTVMEISELREEWPRTDLLRLRAALMKLVSPEKSLSSKNPEIEIKAKHEEIDDNKEIKKNSRGVAGLEGYSNLIVNGKIVNDIFEKIGVKTTLITVELSAEGNQIKTRIDDRGLFVFEITRKNETYNRLKNIKAKVFYLNRSAKVNFARRMGVDSVNYGSIFIYKNGFRIYPFGLAGSDFFGINERKSQGYNRYLGTRELLGRVEIEGDNEDFIEKTSRDGGFIENLSTKQLEDFFISEVIRVLEKYVVDGIDWGDPEKDAFKEGLNEQGLMPVDVAEKIVQQFANLTKRGEIVDAHINSEILCKVNPEKTELQKSIKGLEKIALATESVEVQELLFKIKEESAILKKEKEESDKSVDELSEKLRKKEVELTIREKQTADLQRKIKIDSSQYEDALHIIYALTDDSIDGLEKAFKKIQLTDEFLADKISNSIQTMKRINRLSDLAINYDYSITKKKPRDLVETVKKYVKDFWCDKLNVYVETPQLYKVVCNFDISRISLIVDNILSNSKKFKAKNVVISIHQKDEFVFMHFADDGMGINSAIENREAIFERSYSTTGGLGLGLYHLKKMITDVMFGDIQIDKSALKGFALEVKFKYECKF